MNTAMEIIPCQQYEPEEKMKHREDGYNEKYLEFIKAFAEIGQDSGLFPKTCRTCGNVYKSFPDYINRTSPVAHGLEPYTDSMDVLRTMQYRNCRCGSTLSINFTSDTFPLLERFWEMMGKQSKETGKPVREIVLEFREQCNRFMLEEAQGE
jgi:hypothetical protein